LKSIILTFGAVLFLLFISNLMCGHDSFRSADPDLNVDDLVFIHHSVGQNWLEHSLNTALISKDYIENRNGITYGTTIQPNGGRPASLGEITGDYTDMQHWIFWFNDYLDGIKIHNCINGINRIIMFKSCYPNNNITADGIEPGNPFSSTRTIANYKSIFRHSEGPGNLYNQGGFSYQPLEDIFAQNPENLFIVIISPPRHYAPIDATNDAEAHRARLFASWLKSEWLSNYNIANPSLNNVAVFDMFDALSYADDHPEHPNRLKSEYGGESGDSHPNGNANAYLTQIFASNVSNLIDAAWAAFNEGESGIKDPSAQPLPSDLFIYPNFPNPFNPVTSIRFNLQRASQAKLEILNIRGECLQILLDEYLACGEHHISWNASQYASGLYFLKLTAGSRAITRKITLLK